MSRVSLEFDLSQTAYNIMAFRAGLAALTFRKRNETQPAAPATRVTDLTVTTSEDDDSDRSKRTEVVPIVSRSRMQATPKRLSNISAASVSDEEDPEDDVPLNRPNSVPKATPLDLDDAMDEDLPPPPPAVTLAVPQPLGKTLGKQTKVALDDKGKKPAVALSARALQRAKEGKSTAWFNTEWWRLDSGFPPKLKAAIVDGQWPQECEGCWKAWAATEPVGFVTCRRSIPFLNLQFHFSVSARGQMGPFRLPLSLLSSYNSCE